MNNLGSGEVGIFLSSYLATEKLIGHYVVVRLHKTKQIIEHVIKTVTRIILGYVYSRSTFLVRVLYPSSNMTFNYLITLSENVLITFCISDFSRFSFFYFVLLLSFFFLPFFFFFFLLHWSQTPSSPLPVVFSVKINALLFAGSYFVFSKHQVRDVSRLRCPLWKIKKCCEKVARLVNSVIGKDACGDGPLPMKHGVSTSLWFNALHQTPPNVITPFCSNL